MALAGKMEGDQEESQEYRETQASLERMQKFDPITLIQKEKLGQYSLEEAVAPARRIIDLFAQLPLTTLSALPDEQLAVVRKRSDGAYQVFQQVLDFDLDAGDNNNRRQYLIDLLKADYQGHFSNIFPFISYSVARTVDFNRLEQQGRAAVQSIRDRTEELMAEIDSQKVEAARILDEVRKTAAERGISQEAHYFKREADEHQAAAIIWNKRTVRMALAVVVYGLLSLVLHKVPWLSPSNNYETVQLIAGKLVVFFVLAYMLAICARNFLSNRHNEIVNRHRQNALMTYKSLVDAGGTPEARDVILNHAAASVYQLHDTGFTKAVEGGGSSSSSIIGLLPKGSGSTSSAQH